MRVVKEHDERRNEIIDTAARLFVKKGYQKCSVNDILKEIGIAKGTFYYYFASKEEVLDAIIERSVEQVAANVEQVIQMPNLTSDQKLLAAFMAMNQSDPSDHEFIEEMHKPENALMHQKSLTGIVLALVPLFTGLVEEGILKGDYKCEFPMEDMKIFLTASMTLLDDGIVMESPQEKQQLFAAMIRMLEQMLGVEKNQFLEQAMKNWNF